jgi:UDP-N-acetylmuramate: L-alanyl-gamma-D-glutamyl-meso-diaminopimelate ligase
VIANAADPGVVDVVSAASQARISWYALDGEPIDVPPHWLAAPAGEAGTTSLFELYAGGVAAGRFASPLPGRHNLKNAVAAIAAAAEGFGATLESLRSALPRFLGVKRRQDLLGTPGGIAVYDDFAHHPTAVRETLAALRKRHATGELLAAFEPRSATACRAMHQREYAASFDHADRVLLAPLGREGLAEDERLDLDRLAEDLRARGVEAEACPTVDRVLESLVSAARPGDVIALLSNGAFGGIHARLMTTLEAKDGRPTT